MKTTFFRLAADTVVHLFRLAAAGTAVQSATGPTCRRPLIRFLCFALLLILFAGCPRSETPAPPEPPTPQEEVKAPPPPQPLAAPAPKPPEPKRKAAQVGVGAKGRYDKTGPAAFVTVPVGSYFTIKERIAYDIEIPKAMQLFKGIEGRAPKSHEEFMEKIIKANMIRLPQLPPGDRYIYDPNSEQLMVEESAQ
jgi:hypothetical protein